MRRSPAVLLAVLFALVAVGVGSVGPAGAAAPVQEGPLPAKAGSAVASAPADVAGADAGTPRAYSSQTAENGTVSGTVTDENGTAVEGAYVLLEPADGELIAEATSGDRAVVESLLRLAQTDPDGVYVARTGEDGRFEATVPAGKYEIVAVGERRVGPVRSVDAQGGADLELVVGPDRVLSVETATASRVEAGETAAVELRVINPGDEPAAGLVVEFGSLPGGWQLERVETGGDYDPEARSVTFDELAPGGAARMTLSLQVPDDAAEGRYEIPVEATSDTHYVEAYDDVAVEVGPPTSTPRGGPGVETVTPQPVTEGPTDPPGAGTPTPHGEDAQPVPGPGLAGAALAVAGAAVALARRGDRA